MSKTKTPNPSFVAAEPEPGFEAATLRAASAFWDIDRAIIIPIAQVEDDGGVVHIVAAPTTMAGRDAEVAALRRLCAAFGARGIAFIAEAWVRDYSLAGDFLGTREVVQVLVEHVAIGGGLPRLWHAEIVRSAGCAMLGPWLRDAENVSLRGRMIGLLPRPAGEMAS